MDYGYGGTTSYGAQGGADGGGFLGGSQAGSQDTPGGGKKYGQDTLRPVTIKQLLDATIPYPDADPKIDDASLTQAHFIGQVRQVSPQATNTTYKVDDGTAVIDVKQWVDSDAAVDDEKYVPKEGDYVHVYGKLKEFNGKRHIGPQAIRPVTDFNEINYHLLSATAVHLYFARGPPGQANGGVKSEGDGLFVDGNAGGSNGVGGRKLPAGMSAMTKRIYEFLQNSPQNNEGLHVHDIARQLNVPSNEVFKSGDELILQGFIYTTIDDETWAVLE